MIGLIIAAVIAVIAIMFVIAERRAVINMKNKLRDAQENTIKLEQKITESRNNLKKSKDELEQQKNALQDARELSRKKLKKQALADNDQPSLPNEAMMNDKAFEDNQKAIKAMEEQVEQLKKEKARTEDDIRASLAVEMSKQESEKDKEIESLKKKFASLEEELKSKKKLLRPEGIKIDLSTLPDEAAGEFARVYRKADHHEKLHGIARAKLHLAQEKFAELQKRYFSVCRELAMLSGNKDDSLEPSQVRDIAEKMVSEHKEQDN